MCFSTSFIMLLSYDLRPLQALSIFIKYWSKDIKKDLQALSTSKF